MKPRILLLSTSLGLGGADRQILYLAHALLEHQYEVKLVSMTGLGEMGSRALSQGFPILSLEMQRGRADWASFQRLVGLLQEWRPHVLTSFMYHANLFGRLAGKWAGVPLIVTSIRSERNESNTRDWLMRLTNWMDDAYTTNSQEVADSLLRRGMLARRKVRVIPNGVDIAALTAPPETRSRLRAQLEVAPEEFVWLAIGRLLPQKDYPTMLRALKPLAGTARLFIAGRGPLLDQMKELAQQLGIGARVGFLGVRDDIAALLAAADGFVLSSAWEGMPNVVMEALAAARPVVATSVGGVPELVQPDVSGWLAPPRNPGALSQAMDRLMALPPEQRREMGLAGHRHVAAHYALETMAQRWMTLYRDLLLQRGLSVAESVVAPTTSS
ncbi:MAG TPA: glycosyltransferase [Gemmatimonadales bacterium]|nr:glycosyltransferase [Gemmatimonadales bacterium]